MALEVAAEVAVALVPDCKVEEKISSIFSCFSWPTRTMSMRYQAVSSCLGAERWILSPFKMTRLFTLAALIEHA